MYYLAIAGITALPLTLGELGTRVLHLEGEGARKFVHVLGGVAAAVLGLLYRRADIAVVVASFVLIMLPVRHFLHRKIQSLYAIQRRSYGEVLFPAGVALAAAFASSTDQYLAAILMLGFSDTAAAIVGGRLPRCTYRVCGHQKSLTGNLAFAIVSITVCLLAGLSFPAVALSAVAGTVVEAIGVNGADNLLVPLVVSLV